MEIKNKNGTFLQYINKIKVAVAVAIIRMRPFGMSAETLTATLSERILKDSHSWIMRCSYPKPLIQEMVLDFQSPLKSKNGHGFSNLCVVSSKIRLGKQRRAVIPCIENVPSSSKSTLQKITFIDFMNSLYYLKNISELNSFLMDGTDLTTFISKHAKHILIYLKSYGGYQLPIRAVENAIRTIHNLQSSSYMMLRRNLAKICALYVDLLVSDILHSTEINVFSEQHRYSSIIQIIGHHDCVVVEIISKLMRYIVGYLKYILNGKTMDIYNLHPTVFMDNLYFLFESLYGVMYFSAGTDESDVHPVSLPAKTIKEWRTMIAKIVEYPYINMSMFYMSLIEMHSIIFTTFKLRDFLSIT